MSQNSTEMIYTGEQLKQMNSKYPWNGCIKLPINFSNKKEYILKADMSVYSFDNGRGYVAVPYKEY